MQRDAVSCPRCGTRIDVPALNYPLKDPASADVTGTILKRCPRCRAWSWMSMQAQEAT